VSSLFVPKSMLLVVRSHPKQRFSLPGRRPKCTQAQLRGRRHFRDRVGCRTALLDRRPTRECEPSIAIRARGLTGNNGTKAFEICELLCRADVRFSIVRKSHSEQFVRLSIVV